MKGSKYRKVDLHLHTPASTCYQDRGATLSDIVNRAIDEGLEVIAITDHNSAASLDEIRAVAKGKSIHIFPGVEITSSGAHILALFDLATPKGQIEALLNRVGILPAQYGRKEALAEDAKKVIKEIARLGGLAIAAHANSTNGLLKHPQGQYRKQVTSLPQLAALEFTKRDDIEKFTQGKVPGYPAKACIQSSDAHSLDQIGRRATYLKMDKISLEAIEQSLLDHEVKVRFSWNTRQDAGPRLLALKVSQGFFEEQSFAFHANLNCLVGGKGTGKSTVIEILRYVFDSLPPPDFEDILRDTKQKIQKLVGEGGVITVVCADSRGEELTIERRVISHKPTPPICRTAAGVKCEVPFTPHFFSQGELWRYAGSTQAQMRLIDDHIDLEELEAAEEELIEGLRGNARRILQLEKRHRQQQSEIDDPKHGRSVVEGTVSHLEKYVKAKIFKEFPLWQQEAAFLDNAKAGLETATAQLEEAISAVDADDIFQLNLDATSPNRSLLSPLARVSSTVAELQKQAVRFFRGEIKKLEGKERQVRSRWKVGYDLKEAEYNAALKDSEEKNLNAIQVRLAKARDRLAQLVAFEQANKRIEHKLLSLREEREKNLGELDEVRERRFRKRRAIADSWDNRLGSRVRLAVEHQADRIAFAAQLKEVLEGSGVYGSVVEDLVDTLTPRQFVDFVMEDDAKDMLTGLGVTEKMAEKLVAHFRVRGETLMELQTAKLEDVPRIEFEVAPGIYKPLDELSTGGKSTVMILLALIVGSEPLVVDQPEDSLDSAFIYDEIVGKIRDGKEARQFIFATHNPNILVGSDADLSFVLSATATRGEVASEGGLDRLDTRNLLMLHLEGGPGAFEARGKKWGKRYRGLDSA